MKFVKTGIGILVLTLVFAACKNVDFDKTKNGVPYKIIPSSTKDTTKVRVGSFVKYQYLMKLTGAGKDSVLNSSYDMMPAYQPVDSGRSYGNDIADAVNEVMLKLKKGDSVHMTFIGDSLILRNPKIVDNFPIKKGETLIFTLKILEVFKDQTVAQEDYKKERGLNANKIESTEIDNFKKAPEVQAQMQIDNKIIEDHLKANNIQAQKTPWGAYIQIITPGTDPKPTFGKYVNVKYNGMHLNGESFDAGNYPVQMGMGGAIRGFEEGIRNLGTGGKAKVFVPSMLGYGPRGSEPKIKPNEVLVFDIEVLSIGDNPPGAPQALTDSVQKK